jgi:hypothetical protein
LVLSKTSLTFETVDRGSSPSLKEGVSAAKEF